MKRKFCILQILIAIFLTLSYYGCGGGGGGGDGGGGSGDGSGTPYSGLTTQAAVDENNATDLASGAFAAGQTGGVAAIFAAVKENKEQDSLQIDSFRTLKLPSIFINSLSSIDLTPPLYIRSSNTRESFTETGMEYGSCGGSVSYTLTLNAETGNFSGNMVYSKYCDEGITISGKCLVNGTADMDTGDIVTITISADNLKADTMTIDADFSMDFSVSPVPCTINGYFKDEVSGSVYWIRNYIVYIATYAGYNEVEIIGRYYDPEEGYVNVSTPEPFVIYDGDDWPSFGSLLIEGIWSTTAMLTAINNEVCRVEADTDGDGQNDCDSGVLNWTEFESFDAIEFTGAYLQYRTYSDDTRNQYRGWVDFLNHGQPIIESEIEKIVLKDEDNNDVQIDVGDFDDGEFYNGRWNEDTQQVDFNGTDFYSGFSIEFPEGVTLYADHDYQYEATTSHGNKLTRTVYYPEKLELMVVDSASMNSQWVGDDLHLTWTNPDPVTPDQVTVWLFNEENGFELFMNISLPKTASEVTIPAEWVDKVKELSNSDVMKWLIQPRAFTTNNNYARSYSDAKTIDGWDN